MTEKSVRGVKLWSPRLRWEVRSDGSMLVWREDKLRKYPDKMNERLVHWATIDPDRTWMADRLESGEWRRVTYGECLCQVRAIGQALLDLGLSTERPLAILADNSIEHALMAPVSYTHLTLPTTPYV